MIGKQSEVAAHLKEKVNPFLTSVHCVAHITTLMTTDVQKLDLAKTYLDK